jgi:hypothetical protein
MLLAIPASGNSLEEVAEPIASGAEVSVMAGEATARFILDLRILVEICGPTHKRYSPGR